MTIKELDGQAFLQWDSQSAEATQGHEIAITDISSGVSHTEYREGDTSKLDLSNIKRCHKYRLKMRSENRCGWSTWSSEIQFTLEPSGKYCNFFGLSAPLKQKHELSVFVLTNPITISGISIRGLIV